MKRFKCYSKWLYLGQVPGYKSHISPVVHEKYYVQYFEMIPRLLQGFKKVPLKIELFYKILRQALRNTQLRIFELVSTIDIYES